MTKITVLPPQQTPAQVTAYRRPQDLEEHLLAFLNANNKEGFVDDQKVVPVELMAVPEIMAMEDATLADLLMLLSEHQYIGYEQFKKLVRKVQVSVNTATGRKTLKMGRTFEMVSRLFGYKTHAALCALAKLRKDGKVRNFRFQQHASEKVFDSEPQKGKYRGMPQVRVAFNKTRKST